MWWLVHFSWHAFFQGHCVVARVRFSLQRLDSVALYVCSTLRLPFCLLVANLDCTCFLATVNNANMGMGVKIAIWLPSFGDLGGFLESLGHAVVLSSCFKGTTIPFSIAAIPFLFSVYVHGCVRPHACIAHMWRSADNLGYLSSGTFTFFYLR